MTRAMWKRAGDAEGMASMRNVEKSLKDEG